MLTSAFSATLQFFKRKSFRREMLAVILLKLIALVLIWEYCFPHPKEQLNKPDLVNHFITAKNARLKS